MILRDNGEIESDNSCGDTSISNDLKSCSDDSHVEGDLLMRENTFHPMCHVLGNLCFVIIDGGSCVNVASERLCGELVVDCQVKLSFTIGKLKIRKVIHDGVTNRFTFVHMGRKVTFGDLFGVGSELATLLNYLSSPNEWTNRVWIPHVEFAYNWVFNTTTSYSCFELAYGFNPFSLLNLFPYLLCLIVLTMKAFLKFSLFKNCIIKLGCTWKGKNNNMLEVAIREGKRFSLKKETLCGFPYLRKSKLLPRGDDPFKILRKINYMYQVEMPLDFGGNVEEPTLRANSLQERDDDAYTKMADLTREGPITRSRLRRIQEEVQH
ncbi:hypothetical protein CR513_36992, partial [Mucuna pruriens]